MQGGVERKLLRQGGESGTGRGVTPDRCSSLCGAERFMPPPFRKSNTSRMLATSTFRLHINALYQHGLDVARILYLEMTLV